MTVRESQEIYEKIIDFCSTNYNLFILHPVVDRRVQAIYIRSFPYS